MSRARQVRGKANKKISAHFLEVYGDAFNRHDVDALLSMMTKDCVFETAAGPDACGARHVGQQAVRTAFAAIFVNFPDSKWSSARHFVDGDRGLSEWTYTATRADGSRIEVNGCDVFTFVDGKIAIKNAYRKDRPSIPGKAR
jgi:ketosteroid isomerase-like protein